jgi:hypothetical protein
MEKLFKQKRRQDGPYAKGDPIHIDGVNTMEGLKGLISKKDPIPVRQANMDDTLVFAAKKVYNQTTCKKWKAVFDSNGRLRIDRKL